MARVCIKDFPLGSFPYQKEPGFYMDSLLKSQIDVLLKNIKNDWDFTILITGSGEVRVGKSVLAMQIAKYWSYQIKELYDITVPFSVEDNMVLDGKKLIETGNRLGNSYPYATLIFDEAGADLEGRKVMQTSTQNVLDFYRECGQYNLLNILVLPEFFDLPKGIALSRSICLIDVYYTTNEEDLFERGFFKFFSRRNKKFLYLKGKKELNYTAHKYNFNGRFMNVYTVDETKYRAAKQIALKKRESKQNIKYMMQRDAAWYILNKEYDMTQVEIARRMERIVGVAIGRDGIYNAIKNLIEKFDNAKSRVASHSINILTEKEDVVPQLTSK